MKFRTSCHFWIPSKIWLSSDCYYSIPLTQKSNAPQSYRRQQFFFLMSVVKNIFFARGSLYYPASNPRGKPEEETKGCNVDFRTVRAPAVPPLHFLSICWLNFLLTWLIISLSIPWTTLDTLRAADNNLLSFSYFSPLLLYTQPEIHNQP